MARLSASQQIALAEMAGIFVAFGAGLIVPDLAGFFRNIAVSTVGNVIGGGVLVAAVYWTVFRTTIGQAP